MNNAHLLPIGAYETDFGNTDSLIDAGVLIADGDSSIVSDSADRSDRPISPRKNPAVSLPAGSTERHYSATHQTVRLGNLTNQETIRIKPNVDWWDGTPLTSGIVF
jgi:hypothetical protein